eukprot:Opistho-2@54813
MASSLGPAAYPTTTDYLADFWQQSHDTWATLWARIAGDRTEWELFVWGTFLVHMTLFWGVNALLAVVDIFQVPKFLLRYKIQPGQNQPLNPWRFAKSCLVVLLNQLFWLPALTAAAFPIAQWRGISALLPLPRFERVIFDIAVFGLLEEVGFYYSHRALHHPIVYKNIHKMHHEWTAPIGISALYCHPLEFFLSNLFPIILGPLIMGSHLLTMWLWFSMAIIVTVNVHSGYHFPLMPSPEFHDFHHLKFNNNFGVIGILDYLHGTDQKFRSSKQFQNHKTLLSLEPLVAASSYIHSDDAVKTPSKRESLPRKAKKAM